MQNEPVPGPPSTQSDAWTWIMIAILLVLATGIAFGSLALTRWNHWVEQPTGSQTVPTTKK
jgi:hypothetical protein